MIPYEVYAEATPNPAAMKFVTSRMLIDPGMQLEFKNSAEVKGIDLLEQLFRFPFVKKILLSGNYIMIYSRADWNEFYMEVRNFISEYLNKNGFSFPTERISAGNIVSDEDKSQKKVTPLQHTAPKNETEARIIQILDEFIRPGVELDGGFIAFRKIEGKKLFVELRGSCEGCPSSRVTLKSGIEMLLKRVLPDIVEEVVSESETEQK
jgi:Fe-S cluster biogenesis protein NfuA